MSYPPRSQGLGSNLNSAYYLLRRLTRPAYRITGIGLGRVCELIRRTAAKHAPRTPLVINDFRGHAKFNCYLRDHMGSQIFFRGSYSEDQLSFLEQSLDTSAVFIDVGANQGEFTIAAADIVRHGKIIAFEPVQEYRERLVANIRLNGYSNIQIVPVALGEANGSMPIFDAEGDFCDGTKHEGLTTLFASETRSWRRETVAVKTLDSILDQLNVSRVDVIKLDIEGAEWMALRGAVNALAKYRPVLILEIGKETCRAAGYEAEDFVAWLIGQNYCIVRIADDKNREPISATSLVDFQNVVAYPA